MRIQLAPRKFKYVTDFTFTYPTLTLTCSVIQHRHDNLTEYPERWAQRHWGRLGGLFMTSSVPKAAELEVLILQLLQRREKLRNIIHLWLRVSCMVLMLTVNSYCDSDEPTLPSVTSSNYRKYQTLLVHGSLNWYLYYIMLNYCRIPNSSVPCCNRGVNGQGMTANTSIIGQGAAGWKDCGWGWSFRFIFWSLKWKTVKKQNKTTVPMMSIRLITAEVGTLLSQHSMRLAATFPSQTIGTARPIPLILLSTENIWEIHFHVFTSRSDKK